MTTGSPSAAPVGRSVQLVASDPWDFVAADGSVRFAATVIDAATHREGADEERFVLQLRDPVEWHDKTIEFFVARERHGHGMIDDLSLGQPIECALVAVDRERALGADPFDTSWWRGGLAVNATLRAV
jgi:hypothetical protein